MFRDQYEPLLSASITSAVLNELTATCLTSVVACVDGAAPLSAPAPSPFFPSFRDDGLLSTLRSSDFSSCFGFCCCCAGAALFLCSQTLVVSVLPADGVEEGRGAVGVATLFCCFALLVSVLCFVCSCGILLGFGCGGGVVVVDGVGVAALAGAVEGWGEAFWERD